MQIENFNDLPLKPRIMKGIEELGFVDLFPIQARAIIPLLEGKDVIGQAQTGTGKTAAFGIPMVERIDSRNNRVQGLILTPTRELAIQVANRIERFGRYAKVRVIPIYGGESINKQIHDLDQGVQIVVSTPGRLIDHLNRGTINLSETKIVVLDEADRMLDMGFIEDINYILSNIPQDRQLGLFSATIDQNVMKICRKFMRNPEEILVSKDEIALDEIDQYYIIINPRNKLKLVLKLLKNVKIEKGIIFCNTRKGTDWLAYKLRIEGYDAKPLHGGYTQFKRECVCNSFRTGELKLLIATDVAARGLDINGITHIINYDIPLDALVYFHRIGRTARMKTEGTAISFVGYGEIGELNRIKNLTKTNIEEFDQMSPQIL